MIINYIGVYGICIKDNKLLCIKKVRGPYKNRFDLPGGSQKESEGLTETLVREFQEETGCQIKGYGNCRAYDVFVEESNRTVHHIMVFYNVDINLEQQDTISEKLEDELNDSSGIYWIDFEELDINNSSPLILKFKQELSNDKGALEKVVYKNWEIL
ncbi:NUDIX domain-containing protein [uncultured Gemella sp.]|uniref:NUDIX hydrolase n=1 Tax=uncultured Gemella sp. TaxID=254352 RepID=UPI0028D40B37|nr:NUDIX domain-containing protein [uncultured Gemella sp.]